MNINGRRIYNIRFDDDTKIERPTNVDGEAQFSLVFELDISTKRIKDMIISKNSTLQGQLYIKNQKIDRVNTFSYLGNTLNEEWRTALPRGTKVEEERRRIILLCETVERDSVYLKKHYDQKLT